MKYYLVKVDEEMKIIKVRPELEGQFWEEYGGRVKAEADSMLELLLQLDKLRL